MIGTIQQSQRHTIFRSVYCLTLEQLEEEKQAAREYLIDEGLIEDKEYGEHEVIVPGCSHCRKTYGDLITDELNDRERLWYADEKANLDKKLDGTLYAIVDVGRWNGCHMAYKRLTSKVRDKDGLDWHVDNLNSVLGYFDCDYIDVWYQDGEIKSIAIHHDSSHYVFFREFFSIDLAQDDQRREEYGYSIEPDDFEGMLCGARSEAEWLEIVNKYTKPVGHYAAEIFGWPSQQPNHHTQPKEMK